MPFDRTSINLGNNEEVVQEKKEVQLNNAQKRKERIIEFIPIKPKFNMSNLIVSDRVYDELSTVIAAERCWKKVFVDWGLSIIF